MKKTKILTILAIIFLALNTSLAAGENPQPEKAVQSSSNQITIGEAKKTSLFNIIQFLSSVDAPNQVEPGSNINFDIVMDVKESFTTENHVKVVEIYRCEDSGCDDPSQDVLIDSISKRFDSSKSFDTNDEISWNVNYNVPTRSAHYAAVAYVYDIKSQTLKTESPKKIFKVGSPDDTKGGGGKVGTANIVSTKNPEISVSDSGSVSATVTLKNIGDKDMSQQDIVEMQVVKPGTTFASFVGSQQVCDPDFPANVNKPYRINSGETVTINLNAKVEPGKVYEVRIFTADDCFEQKVPPFDGAGFRKTFAIGQTNQGKGLLPVLGVFAAILGIIVVGGVILFK